MSRQITWTQSLLRAGSGFLLAAGVLALPMATVLAQTHTIIGVSPSTVIEEHALRDVAIMKTVTVQRDLSAEPVTFAVTFEGSGAAFLSGPAELVMDIGQTKADYSFDIHPVNAPNGEYAATVIFTPTMTSEQISGGAGLAILRGVQANIRFTVTDEQLLLFTVKSASVFSTEPELPMIMSYIVENSGNVSWRPDEIRLVFEDDFSGATTWETVIDGGQLEFAEPGGLTEVIFEIDHELPPSNYNLSMEFYDDGEQVEVLVVGVSVLQPGTLAQKAEFISLTTNKENYLCGETVKVIGTFRNVGSVPVIGKMVTEVYLADGTLLDIFVTEELRVGPGDEDSFNQVVKVNDVGEARIVAYVEYGNQQTPTREAVISLESGLLSEPLAQVPIYIAAVIAAAILAFTLFGLLKRLFKRPQAPQVIGPVDIAAGQINGQAKAKNGSLVEVLLNHEPLGRARVQAGAWALALKPGTLHAGEQITARLIGKSGRAGRESMGLVVQAPGQPQKPPVATTPASTSALKPAVAPKPALKPAPMPTPAPPPSPAPAPKPTPTPLPPRPIPVKSVSTPKPPPAPIPKPMPAPKPLPPPTPKAVPAVPPPQPQKPPLPPAPKPPTPPTPAPSTPMPPPTKPAPPKPMATKPSAPPLPPKMPPPRPPAPPPPAKLPVEPIPRPPKSPPAPPESKPNTPPAKPLPPTPPKPPSAPTNQAQPDQKSPDDKMWTISL